MKKLFALISLITSLNIYSKSTILIIGDSHTAGYFGQALDSLFKADEQYQIATYGVGGAIGRYYFQGTYSKWGYYFSPLFGKIEQGDNAYTPLLSELINHIKPDLIIVALGMNYLNYDQMWAKADLQKLERTVKAEAKIIWVGPPNANEKNKKNIEKIYQLLNQSLAPNTLLIDSRLYSEYPNTGKLDGIHYWGAAGKLEAGKWAQSIYNLTKQVLQY
ncbi:MAG: SGNH/GDSL hydrolase family protein [Bacteriovoracaceae bacterium]|nr:SGNH/GDSL hydrolase family protein [Bacteriovoracaceae bacterium]